MGTLKYQVLIVGGGTAGLTVAARLRRYYEDVEVAILDPARDHFYQPLWTLVGAGVVPKEATRREEGDLIPPGAKWIQEAVVAFEPEESSVTTSSNRKLRYDFLVVAPGIQIDWNKIEGLEATLGRNGVCSNYSYEHVDYTWQCLNEFAGGDALFTFPATPVKCAGAPQKIMYLADDCFRRHHVRERSRVRYFAGNGVLFSVKKYADALAKVVERRGIETVFKEDCVAIHGDKKEVVFRNVDTKATRVERFDLLHVTPPMSAPDVLKSSPLAGPGGWVSVDKFTLRHPRYANVFSLGDASGLPTSRTAAAIRKQAPVLVENLMAALQGREGTARYDGYTSCPLVTGYGKLILAEFDYELNPCETFPFDQSKERASMYLLKKHVLPALYWQGMLKGLA